MDKTRYSVTYHNSTGKTKNLCGGQGEASYLTCGMKIPMWSLHTHTHTHTHRISLIQCRKHTEHTEHVHYDGPKQRLEIWAKLSTHILGCTHMLPNTLHTSFTSLMFQGEVAKPRKGCFSCSRRWYSREHPSLIHSTTVSNAQYLLRENLSVVFCQWCNCVWTL